MNSPVQPASDPPSPAPTGTGKAWLLFGLLAVLLLLLFDWNWFKGPIERRVEAATGREFHIHGELEVHPAFFLPTVIANDVTLGNADWAGKREMLRVARAEITFSVWRLLIGQWVLPEVQLRDAVLNLERDADGRANWTFRETDKDAPARYPDIHQLWIRGGELHLLEKPFKTDLVVAVRSGTPAQAGGFAPVLLAGEGRYRGNDFQLQGRVDSPLALINAEQRFRIDLVAQAGDTRTRAFGMLQAPLQFSDFDLGFELSGDDMAQLYPLLGLAIPTTSAYALKGNLSRVGAVWNYRDITGVVGDSDLAGEIGVDTSGERNRLSADLRSERLDFDDLAGFIGGQPRVGEGDRPARTTPTGRLFPESPYDLGKLRAMDADVRLRAARVTSPTLPLESMDAHLKLVDGELRLDPMTLGVAGGEIESRIHLDSRQDPIAAQIKLTARHLELPKLVPDGAPESAGRIGAKIDIRGRGNSVAALMATANGDIGLAMGPGRISNLTLELAGLDIAEALKFMIGKDQVVPVRCGFADFGVAKGVMTTRAFAFDTTDTLLLAEGSINLGDETLDLILRPRPKDASPLSLRSPLRVRGTLSDPTIRPQGGPLLLRSAVAVALYALAPPAALLGLIETGPGENADCAGGAEAQKAEARQKAGP